MENGVIVDPGGLTTGNSTLGDIGLGGGCFIATAAFGSYVEPHVKLLREFRDQHLLTNRPGRCFVRMYYKYGPYAADCIEEHNWLKPVVRALLMPLVGISYILIKISSATKILLALVMLFSILVCWKSIRANRGRVA